MSCTRGDSHEHCDSNSQNANCDGTQTGNKGDPTINNDITIMGDSVFKFECGVVQGDVYVEQLNQWTHDGGFMYGSVAIANNNIYHPPATSPTGGGGSAGGGGGGSTGGGGGGNGGSDSENDGNVSDGSTSSCPPFGAWHEECAGNGYGGDGQGTYIPDESHWPDRNITPVVLECEEFSWNDAAYEACLDVIGGWGEGGIGWFESSPASLDSDPTNGSDGDGDNGEGNNGNEGDNNNDGGNNSNNDGNNNNYNGDTNNREDEPGRVYEEPLDLLAAVVSTIGPPSVVQMYLSTYNDFSLSVDWEAFGQTSNNGVANWLNVADAFSLTGMAVNGMIEYRDSNNDAMFNSGDVILNEYSFGDSSMWQWDQMINEQVTKQVHKDADEETGFEGGYFEVDVSEFKAQATMVSGNNAGATFDIAFKMASREVVVDGSTLNPNRTKVDISFDGLYRTEAGSVIALDVVMATSEIDESVDEEELSDFLRLGTGYADWEKVAQNSTYYVDPTQASVGTMRVVASGFREVQESDLNPQYAFSALVRRTNSNGNTMNVRVLQTYFSFIDDCHWVQQPTRCNDLLKDSRFTTAALCQQSCCGDPSCTLWQFNSTEGCNFGYRDTEHLLCDEPDFGVDASGLPFYSNFWYVGGWRQNVKDPFDQEYSSDWAMYPMSCFWDPAISYGQIPKVQSYEQPMNMEVLIAVALSLLGVGIVGFCWIFRKKLKAGCEALCRKKRRYSLKHTFTASHKSSNAGSKADTKGYGALPGATDPSPRLFANDSSPSDISSRDYRDVMVKPKPGYARSKGKPQERTGLLSVESVYSAGWSTGSQDKLGKWDVIDTRTARYSRHSEPLRAPKKGSMRTYGHNRSKSSKSVRIVSDVEEIPVKHKSPERMRRLGSGKRQYLRGCSGGSPRLVVEDEMKYHGSRSHGYSHGMEIVSDSEEVPRHINRRASSQPRRTSSRHSRHDPEIVSDSEEVPARYINSRRSSHRSIGSSRYSSGAHLRHAPEIESDSEEVPVRQSHRSGSRQEGQIRRSSSRHHSYASNHSRHDPEVVSEDEEVPARYIKSRKSSSRHSTSRRRSMSDPDDVSKRHIRTHRGSDRRSHSNARRVPDHEWDYEDGHRAVIDSRRIKTRRSSSRHSYHKKSASASPVRHRSYRRSDSEEELPPKPRTSSRHTQTSIDLTDARTQHLTAAEVRPEHTNAIPAKRLPSRQSTPARARPPSRTTGTAMPDIATQRSSTSSPPVMAFNADEVVVRNVRSPGGTSIKRVEIRGLGTARVNRRDIHSRADAQKSAGGLRANDRHTESVRKEREINAREPRPGPGPSQPNRAEPRRYGNSRWKAERRSMHPHRINSHPNTTPLINMKATHNNRSHSTSGNGTKRFPSQSSQTQSSSEVESYNDEHNLTDDEVPKHGQNNTHRITGNNQTRNTRPMEPASSISSDAQSRRSTQERLEKLNFEACLQPPDPVPRCVSPTPGEQRFGLTSGQIEELIDDRPDWMPRRVQTDAVMPLGTQPPEFVESREAASRQVSTQPSAAARRTPGHRATRSCGAGLPRVTPGRMTPGQMEELIDDRPEWLPRRLVTDNAMMPTEPSREEIEAELRAQTARQRQGGRGARKPGSKRHVRSKSTRVQSTRSIAPRRIESIAPSRRTLAARGITPIRQGLTPGATYAVVTTPGGDSDDRPDWMPRRLQTDNAISVARELETAQPKNSCVSNYSTNRLNSWSDNTQVSSQTELDTASTPTSKDDPSPPVRTYTAGPDDSLIAR